MAVEGVLPLGGFYQFGYVTRDLDAALDTLRDQFGVTRYRRKRNADWMEAIHAWVGDSQIEVLQLSEGAPQMYLDYVPDEPGPLRLQHLGRRIETLEQWEALERTIARGGFDTPLKGSSMNGQLRAVYVDTRALLGIYSEYVYLAGEALRIYEDVPQNCPVRQSEPTDVQ